MTSQRVATGISGLDQMLKGGFLPETANLIEGAPGTGKTTIGMQFIQHGIMAYDEPGIIMTFEEFPQQYYMDAANFGWDFRAYEQADMLRVVMTSPEVTRADLLQVGGRLEAMVGDIGARRVLIDSLSHFDRLADDPVELREVVYEFINGLKRLGLTAILTRENPMLLSDTTEADDDLAFVVDSYALLRYVEIQSVVHKALLILKLRGSDHDKDIRQFSITDQGVEVRSRFEGAQGIMSGNPIMTHAEAFAAAFLPPKRPKR